MDKVNEINLFDDNGKLKDKDQLMGEISEFYDELKQSNSITPIDSVLYDIISPENQFCPDVCIDNTDFYNRAIYINEEVTPEVALDVFKKIQFYNKIDNMDEIEPDDRQPIKIYISTPGGDLVAAFSIISAMESSRTPIHTFAIGSAYSAGFFILISGDKRFGFPYSSYLFHEGAVMDEGDAHKFIQRAKFYEKQLKDIKKIVTNNTEIDEDYYDEIRKDDLFLNAEEALEYGIIDEIVEYF